MKYLPQQARGSFALVVLTSLYGMYGVFNRFIGETFGTFTQQWVRNAWVMGIVLLSMFLLKQPHRPVLSKDKIWIALWLLSGSWIMVLLFIAFNHLYLSTVYFLFYSTMIVSGVICGRFFFAEKLNLVKSVSIALSLFGLTLIYSLSLKPEDYPYVLITLFTGLLLGFWNTISKKFSAHYPELQLVFWDAAASVVVGLIGLIFAHETLPPIAMSAPWIWLAIYGVVQVGTVGLLVYGFKHLEAQIGTVIMPVEIIFGTLFAFLFFREVPAPSALLGGLLIACAAILPSLQGLISFLTHKKGVA